MKILLTNDDGYGKKGLEALYKRLSAENEVWIVAPHMNRSGVSHCITMGKPLFLKKYSERRFSLEGFPADCVITSLKGGFLGSRPDIVIAGINDDANLGTDVVYSGTCAAARQASLYGVPGIALSLCTDGKKSGEMSKLDEIADFAAKNLNALSKLCGRKCSNGGGYKYFVSVNAPLCNEKYIGVKMTNLSEREYKDCVEIHEDKSGMYSLFKGGIIISHGNKKSDSSAVQDGYISVSVVHTQPVCNNETIKSAGLFTL